MYIVSYDISNDKLRRRFSKLLDKHGRRIQYSVFELKHSQRILRIVMAEIQSKYAKKFAMTDSIIIIPVCEACKSKILRYGYAVHEEEELVFM